MHGIYRTFRGEYIHLDRLTPCEILFFHKVVDRAGIRRLLCRTINTDASQLDPALDPVGEGDSKESDDKLVSPGAFRDMVEYLAPAHLICSEEESRKSKSLAESLKDRPLDRILRDIEVRLSIVKLSWDANLIYHDSRYFLWEFDQSYLVFKGPTCRDLRHLRYGIRFNALASSLSLFLDSWKELLQIIRLEFYARVGVDETAFLTALRSVMLNSRSIVGASHIITAPLIVQFNTYEEGDDLWIPLAIEFGWFEEAGLSVVPITRKTYSRLQEKLSAFAFINIQPSHDKGDKLIEYNDWDLRYYEGVHRVIYDPATPILPKPVNSTREDALKLILSIRERLREFLACSELSHIYEPILARWRAAGEMVDEKDLD